MDATKAIKGCNAKITLNGVDISGESNTYSVTATKDTDEVTSFGNCTAQKISGKKDWTGSVDCFFTNDTTTAEATIWNAYEGDPAVPFTLSQNGGGTGDVEFAGNVIVSETSLDGSPTDGPQMISFSFEGSGTLTRSVVA